jgi:hypothetical protein
MASMPAPHQPPRTAPYDPRPTIPRVSGKLVGKPRLTDTGLTADHEHPSAPTKSCIEAAVQLVERLLTTYEQFSREPGIPRAVGDGRRRRLLE